MKQSVAAIKRGLKPFLPWILGSLAMAALLSAKNPWLFPILFAIAIAGALLLRRHQLAGVQKKLRAEVSAELPVVIELLALSVSAGESPTSALARVAQASRGPVGRAVMRATQQMKDGSTLVQALEGIKRELSVQQVDRAIDAIILGYERGTSLGEVLHAQALDVREQYRRSLIEFSARAEIAMMLPVVFLIMPVTILFALFPSLQALTSAY